MRYEKGRAAGTVERRLFRGPEHGGEETGEVPNTNRRPQGHGMLTAALGGGRCICHDHDHERRDCLPHFLPFVRSKGRCQGRPPRGDTHDFSRAQTCAGGRHSPQVRSTSSSWSNRSPGNREFENRGFATTKKKTVCYYCLNRYTRDIKDLAANFK